MSNTRLPIIHIGMPKTGTKTLQWRLFAMHSELYYLGRFDGPIFLGEYRRYEACRDATVYDVMQQVAYRDIHDADIESCRRKFDKYLQGPLERGLIPVWSWESYMTDSARNREQRAHNLRELFGEARIIAGIRHPVALMESAYLQQLKRDNVGGYYRRGKAGYYSSFEDWLARNEHGEVDNHLDYANTIRMYIERFGRENVCVLPFEFLKTDPDAYFSQLCEFMGIDAAEALGLVESSDDNSRWTEIQLDRLRGIGDSWWQRHKFKYASKAERKEMLDLATSGSPLTAAPKARANIPGQLRELLVERTREGNEWLDSLYSLGLKDYGYFSHE